MNKRKIILDLCGGSGAWSAPYKKAGYDVRLVTLPDMDARKYKPPRWVWGILAAPPCDHFAVSGAQYWKQKDRDGRTAEGLSVLDACLYIIWSSEERRGLQWWALENPVGRIPALRPGLGPPRMYFNPCDYGDAYTKKTALWGTFNPPETWPVKPVRVCSQGSWIQSLGGKSAKTKFLRSRTPPGFARAFYQANP